MRGFSIGRSGRRTSVRTRLAALLVAVILTISGAVVVLADAGNPILGTIHATTTFNANGTVTVSVQGEWNWLSHNSDCNFDRAATGVAMIWNDPTETGYLLSKGTVSAQVGIKSYKTTAGFTWAGIGGGTDPNPLDAMVHPVDLGNVPQGLPGVTSPVQVLVNPTPPAGGIPTAATATAWKGGCGREPLTHADAYSGHPYGSWGYQQTYSHTFRSVNDISTVCANFYDVHGGGTTLPKFQLVNGAKEITVNQNGDNSIQTNMFNVNEGANCITVSKPNTPALPTNATSTNLPGGTLSDTVHLSGLNTTGSSPYGTLVFRAYGPNDTASCTTANLRYTSDSQNVTANGDYTSSPAFDPASTGVGNYYWTVEFTTSDSSKNVSTTTSCGAVNETSTVGAITLAKTVRTEPGTIFAKTSTAIPGATLTYQIVLSNSGTVDQTGVSVSDAIPARTTYVASSCTPATNCSEGGGTVSWSGLTVAAGGTTTLTYQVTLDAVFPQGDTTVKNVAVSAQTTNCPAASASTTAACAANTTVSASPVLVVLKVVDNATAIPGAQLLYTITIDNTGNANATGQTASDAIPAKTTYTAGTCTPAANCTFNSTLNQVEWTGLNIAAGTTLTLTFKVDLDPSFPSGTTDVVNTVVVPSSNCAAISVDPTCDATTVVTASPDVSYVKTVSTDNIHFFHTITAAPGQTLYYKIVATNAGNAPFVGDVADQLSTDLVDNSNAATALPGTCGPACTYTVATRTITWSAVSVAANGGTATLLFNVTLNASIPVSVLHLDNGIVSSPCTLTDPACNTTTLLPKTQLTVTDQLTGLAAGATGTVSYTAYTDNACAAGATSLTPTIATVSGGVAPASNPLTIGPGATFGNSAWFTATFTGTGAFLGQNFTTPCTESASSN